MENEYLLLLQTHFRWYRPCFQKQNQIRIHPMPHLLLLPKEILDPINPESYPNLSDGIQYNALPDDILVL
ncbi:hypothetical protein D3C80_738710 [compost metagenome]